MSQAQVATRPSESHAPDSFAAMFEDSLKKAEMRSGEVITAEVVRVEHSFVVVNAGLKSEAYVPIDEFKNDQGVLEVQPGDFVSVAIDAVENGYGDTILSRDKAKRLASWLSLENSLESGEFVTGTVNGKVKGGLTSNEPAEDAAKADEAKSGGPALAAAAGYSPEDIKRNCDIAKQNRGVAEGTKIAVDAQGYPTDLDAVKTRQSQIEKANQQIKLFCH